MLIQQDVLTISTVQTGLYNGFELLPELAVCIGLDWRFTTSYRIGGYWRFRSPIRSDCKNTFPIRSEVNIMVPKSERIRSDRIGFGSDLHISSLNVPIVNRN